VSFTTVQPDAAGAHERSADRADAWPAVSLLLTGKFRTFFAMMRARQELHAMDDRQLQDVGIRRTDINILTALGRMGG